MSGSRRTDLPNPLPTGPLLKCWAALSRQRRGPSSIQHLPPSKPGRRCRPIDTVGRFSRYAGHTVTPQLTRATKSNRTVTCSLGCSGGHPSSPVQLVQSIGNAVVAQRGNLFVELSSAFVAAHFRDCRPPHPESLFFFPFLYGSSPVRDLPATFSSRIGWPRAGCRTKYFC